jgi:hypothetical protein
LNIDILVNGTSKQLNFVVAGGAVGSMQTFLVANGIFLSAGQTLVVRVSTDGSTPSYAANAARHYTMIASV